MRNRKLIRYIVSTTIMITLLICVGIIFYNFSKDKNIGFSPYLYYTTFAVFSFVVGCLLGVEGFLRKVKSEGKWQIDILRLIILGIPSLIFSTFFYLYYLDVFWLYQITYILAPYLQNLYVQIFSQVILGYVLISSFYKSNKDDTQQENEN